jgi:ribulose-5-phosphate 4-epimerase/fuculose-1-phosphate aldolase
MKEDTLKHQLADITLELYQSGAVTAIGGNVSVRCAERENTAWITPSQIFKGDLTPDQMVMIDLEGNKIEGDYKPSMESVYHASIFKHRPEINAVVHTHSPLAVLFGLSDMQWAPITTEAILMSGMPTIAWHPGGSKELAAAVERQVAKTNAPGAFLRNHGLITVGKSLRKAADATYMVEHTIKVLLACKLLGQEPAPIPQENVDLILSLYGL